MSPSVRSLLTISAAVALATLLLCSLPAGASASDKDCADFPTQRAAQFFFLKHGGPRLDPDRLDGDNDGVACEDNPCPCYRRKQLPRRAQLSIFTEDRLPRGGRR
jgi:Excalibur calcium-binding domain